MPTFTAPATRPFTDAICSGSMADLARQIVVDGPAETRAGHEQRAGTELHRLSRIPGQQHRPQGDGDHAPRYPAVEMFAEHDPGNDGGKDALHVEHQAGFRRRDPLEHQIAMLSATPIDRLPDAGRLRTALMKRAADVRRVLSRREPDVRRVLQVVVTERLDFSPFDDRGMRGYQFSGTARTVTS